jgi:peptidoglycan hydrolase CwlO-like protein
MQLKRFSIKITITILMLVGLFTALTNMAAPTPKVNAYDTSCPDHMTAEECLDYLQEQSEQIHEERNELDNSIESENMEQMSLSQQIAYLANKIKDTELSITEKELDIEKKNVEIRLLGEDIIELQNSIDTLVQEINNLEEIIDDRTAASYKLTFVSPLEILLDSKNFESMMRRTKYLVETRKKDRELLADMASSKQQLEKDEQILTDKKKEVQEKRNSIESQMAELAEEKNNLESQKGHQAELLAESRRREQEYEENLEELKAAEAVITQRITQLIMELYNSGQIPADTPVSRGDTIGFQGHTGFSYGSHLHFEVYYNGYPVDPFVKGYLSGGTLYNPVGASSKGSPLAGGYLTQTYWSGHKAIDLVSHTSGIQDGSRYYEDGSNCCNYIGACVPQGSYPLRGEGAPVQAIEAGKITDVRVGYCGGKYTIIDHGGGLSSLYLHLR